MFWRGKRVLDIGANTGGLSLELMRRGAIVTAVEPNAGNRQKIAWWKSKLDMTDDELKVVDAGLFDCHTLGGFDVILCLGLVYHFRHPQLVLDYIGNIPASHYVFSTQTYKSDAHVMVNRKDTNPKDVPGNRLAGWHPSRILFLKMLHVAGFKNPREIKHPAVVHDWGDRPQTTTNSGYFAADAGTPVDIEKGKQAVHLIAWVRNGRPVGPKTLPGGPGETPPA